MDFLKCLLCYIFAATTFGSHDKFKNKFVFCRNSFLIRLEGLIFLSGRK